MSESIVISDLKSRVMSGELRPGGWKPVDYETDLVKGNMLLARKGDNAGSVTLNLNLTGWWNTIIISARRSSGYAAKPCVRKKSPLIKMNQAELTPKDCTSVLIRVFTAITASIIS